MKRRRVVLVLALMIVVLGGGLFLDLFPRSPRIRTTAAWMSPLNSKWRIHSPGKPYSLQCVSDVTRDGQDSLRFELRKGETWDEGTTPTFRSEVNTRDVARLRSVRWYGFSVWLPKDFPKEDNRLSLAQWFAREKTELGEAARSPSLAFRYVDGEFGVTIRHSAERIVRDGDAVPKKTLFRTESFPLGEWNDFVVEARWSFEDDGYVNIWWNGRQIVQYRGPVGYNDDAGPYFQFGLYRDDTDKVYIAYFNQVRWGDTAQAIGFKP